MTHSFLEDIITSSNEVYEDFESDIAVAIWMLHNAAWETVNSYVLVK